MLDYADNYDADATLSDGSCLFSSYTPPSTLDLRLHLDPTNSSSYSGSGTNVADLSGFNNNGTVAAAGPAWDADFTRFTYDGACTGSGPYICDEVNITDSTTLRPGEPYEDLAAKLNQGFSYTKIQAPSTEAGYWVGGVETSFTIQAWLKPTDCETASYATFIQKDNSYSFACTKGFLHYALGSGTGWYGSPWVNTSVPVEDDVWQHVAFTRSGSSNPVKVYLNGVLSFTASSSVSDLGANNSNPLVLGGSLTDSSGTNRYYGLLDDVRIYTSDRSSTIAGDMNEYPNVNDAALNAFFDFNLERHGDTITSVPNMATGAGASSASLTVVSGSPEVVRTWDVSTVGSDTVLTFERTVLTAQGGWRVPTGVVDVEYLVLGGGGGGGAHVGGGGGGGGVLTGNNSSVAGAILPVTVGHGGRGGALLTPGSCGAACSSQSRQAQNGGESQFADISVNGGGSGGHWNYFSPGSGGSGGGSGSSTSGGSGTGTGATRQGYDGGNGDGVATYGYLTGGGGGAGGWGENHTTSSSTSGDGGSGRTSSITGTSVAYGGGGGGGGHDTGVTVGSGQDGGGNGATATATQAGSGTHGLGGGGGGSGGNSGSIASKGGDGGYGVVIVRFASVDHNDWSVATWINASSLQGSTIIGTYDDNGASSDIGWALRIRSATGDLYATVGTTSNTSAAWTSDASIDTDRWYHVVMVADVGNTLRLYLDGVNVANGSLSGSGNLRNVSNNVFLGSYNGGEEDQPFDGQIGSVMAFADALNASNINQLYTSGKGVYSNTTNLSYAQSSSTMILGQTYSFPITVTNGEITTSYSLNGTLPSGMNFESSNGTIWGTPTAAM
ncbi:MAG: LamG domain-containing protein, partial [Poseidonia sp.]